jgi:hypothetical protein
MLNGENNRLKYCLEILDFETKQTSSAIAYNIFNKQEETFPELR